MIGPADTTHASDRHNPFSTRNVRPGVRSYLFSKGDSVGELIDRLEQFEWRAQIVGPHGSGKSTLVQSLRLLIHSAGKVTSVFELHDGQTRLQLDHAELASRGRESMLVIDGFEQLGWLTRRKIKSFCIKNQTGLLVTSHESVGLPTLFETSVSLETATSVVAQILASENAASVISSVDIQSLYNSHGGNLRDLLFGLYDLYERRRRRNEATCNIVPDMTPHLH